MSPPTHHAHPVNLLRRRFYRLHRCPGTTGQPRRSHGPVPAPSFPAGSCPISRGPGHRPRRQQPLSNPCLDVGQPAHFFQILESFQAPINHYKVCSTFDSSPRTGSNGRAIELGIDAFDSSFVPVPVGAPHLRRFVAFGNLFASAPDGEVHRIDRHPMAHHPVTPMQEPDLRLHLARQTDLPIGFLDLTQLISEVSAHRVLTSQLAAGKRILLFDTTSPDHLQTAGQLLWSETRHHSIFTASSSGLTAAILKSWPAPIPSQAPLIRNLSRSKNPLLVVSGSGSATTERQIRHALAHGFHGFALDPIYPERALRPALASLRAGRDTILYTALGPTTESAQGETLGKALGRLAQQLLDQIPLSRILFCGGDTSSHAVPELGLQALINLSPIQPGAPLCEANGKLELILKGGQVGTDDFFTLPATSDPDRT